MRVHVHEAPGPNMLLHVRTSLPMVRRWWRAELPDAILARNPPHMTSAEMQRLVRGIY